MSGITGIGIVIALGNLAIVLTLKNIYDQIKRIADSLERKK